jgi:DNA-binding beta-propeller fold protein YncE
MKKTLPFVFGFFKCLSVLFIILLSGCGGPVGKLATEPEPRSLAVDAQGRVLFVACEGSRAVQAWDLKRKQVAARREVGVGPIRLQFFGEENNLAAVCRGGKQIWFLQTPGLQKLRVLDLPDGPAAWAEGPQTQASFACCPDANLVRMFRDGNPVDPIEIGLKPADLYLQPDSDKLWVANAQSHDLALVSISQGKVLKRVEVKPNPEKFLSISDPDRFFVLCTGKDAVPAMGVLQAIDPVYQTAALTYTLGEGIRDCVLDARGRISYSLGQGSLQIKDLDSGAERMLKVSDDAGALALSPDGKRIFVSSPAKQSVLIYRAPKH